MIAWKWLTAIQNLINYVLKDLFYCLSFSHSGNNVTYSYFVFKKMVFDTFSSSKKTFKVDGEKLIEDGVFCATNRNYSTMVSVFFLERLIRRIWIEVSLSQWNKYMIANTTFKSDVCSHLVYSISKRVSYYGLFLR